MTIKKNNGFTLVETIVSVALLLILSAVCLGVLVNALSLKGGSDAALREQVALRQTLLTVTREIRKNPVMIEEMNLLNPPYKVVENILFRNDGSGSAVAKNVEFFEIVLGADGKAQINIRAVGGQEVTTMIHLRTGI